MIDMVGIGPFITLPIVIGLAGGMYIWAWMAGAFLAFLDAMTWSELGAAYPLAGGSYNFLRVAYGPRGGKLMSFLYVWQTIIQAPLVAASAAIGFSQYITYLLPMEWWQQKLLSGAVIIFVTILLYRKIESIGRIGVFLWLGVAATLGWIIFAGLTHGNFAMPFTDIKTSFNSNTLISFVFGQACVKTVYSYLGYYNVCHLGGEIKNPGKNIPRSMFISVIVIAVLYIAMNLSVTSVIPRAEITAIAGTEKSSYLISAFIERVYGHTSAVVITVLILWVALASLFAVLLGYSRVPFAAARDGEFFRVFAKLHPTKNFPYVSLLVMSGLAFVLSMLVRLSDVISAILAMRIIVQFIGQGVGLTLLRRRNGTKGLPFKMPLYPVPVVLASIIWVLIFMSTGMRVMFSFGVVLVSGIVVYFVKEKLRRKRLI